MPSCFSLTRRGDSEPSSLQYVDRVLCQALDLSYSEDRWAGNWYNNIGLLLAVGKSLDEIIDGYTGHESEHANLMGRMAAYLNEHYITNAWKEWK
jgi:hypothetical protein